MRRCYSAIILAGFLLSTGVHAKLYKINEGSHGAVNFGGDIFPKMEHMKFQAVFNETAIYDIEESDQNDVNKLYGFSDCGSRHMRNSARFGWRWDTESQKLAIYGYTHVDGEYHSSFIDFAELNNPYTYEIKLSGSEYIFRFNGKEITMPRGCNSDNTTALSYKLGPYFGGTSKAPHDIYIYIQDEDASGEILPIELTTVYPNPTCEKVNVLMENHSKDTYTIRLKVYDLTGKFVLETEEIQAAGLSSFTHLLDISLLRDGYYFITASDASNNFALAEELSVAKKIVKVCKLGN